MKKTFLLIYIVLFFLVCTLPGAAMLAGVKTPNLENRQLAALPALTREGRPNLDFPKQFESYLSDNFGLRQYYVTGWAALQYYTLGCSSNGSVIAGRDGWLFFGEEARDFTGRDALPVEDISRICRTLELEREYLASKGICFVFAVAPNKSTVYGQYMPARYRKSSSENNLTMLARKLKTGNVAYADLGSDLASAAGGMQLYHKKDSHWNNAGALIGYNALMETINRAGFHFPYESYSSQTYTLQRSWEGDLETMLLPALGNRDWQVVYDIPQLYQYAQKPRSMEDMRIVTTSGVNAGSLMMFRDSFANALIPFISNNFGYVCYQRSVTCDLTLADSQKPDVVIEEIVERNIPELLAAAPVMPAPRRKFDSLKFIPGSSCVSIDVQKTGDDLTKICGWVSAGGISGQGDALVFVELRNEKVRLYYEPFPTNEKEPPGDLGKNPLGFTMYLDTGALAKGTYSVSLLICSNGDTREIPTNETVDIG